MLNNVNNIFRIGRISNINENLYIIVYMLHINNNQILLFLDIFAVKSAY